MKESELCSLGLMETQTSLSSIITQGKGTGRRFKRSQSSERSKSKENYRLNDNPSFFVKNVFTHNQAPASPQKAKCTLQKSKRENNHIRGQKWSEASLLNKCNELSVLLQSSHSYILQLQNKVSQLEIELKEKHNGVRKAGRQGKQSKSNLALLRKQIAETRTLEVISSETLSQKLKMLQSENLCLREHIQTLKNTIKQQEETNNKECSNRQRQLEKMIGNLRIALIGSQKREDQLRLEVGMLRLRESKQTDNKQQAKNEQLTFMRFRYEKLRKNFEKNRKALQALQRKQASCLYSQQDREISFSLSP